MFHKPSTFTLPVELYVRAGTLLYVSGLNSQRLSHVPYRIFDNVEERERERERALSVKMNE